MKKAKDSEAAWKLEEKYIDLPHGWIQWKGTDVCMDVYCACGTQFHLDVDFCYCVKCPECGRMYHCNGHIEFIEIEEDPGGSGCKTSEDWWV